ncbi:hypothetical protein C0J52_20935, partial [Blattella germanica]
PKSFCILEFARCNSVITEQRHFRSRYQIDPPNGWNIRKWYRQFVDRGCGPGRPLHFDLKSMWHEFKPLFNVVLQNQLVVPVGSYNCLQQQFGDFAKDRVYLPTLQQNLEELKNRIHTALTSVTVGVNPSMVGI